MLRMVPLPRFTGEDEGSGRDARRGLVPLSTRLHAGRGEQLYSSRYITSASTSRASGGRTRRGAADNREAHRLPQADGALVGRDHEIELHGAEAACLRAHERVYAHRPRDAASRCARRDHVAAIGDMRPAARIVRAQIIGADYLAILNRDVHLVLRSKPVGERSIPLHVARQRVGLAGADDRFEDAPDRLLVFGTCRADDHFA